MDALLDKIQHRSRAKIFVLVNYVTFMWQCLNGKKTECRNVNSSVCLFIYDNVGFVQESKDMVNNGNTKQSYFKEFKQQQQQQQQQQ